MDLLWVRHGEPERIAPGFRCARRPGAHRRGRDQAQRLAAWLAVEPVDVVLSSPQRRAVETAAADRRARTALEVEVVDGLIEYDAKSDSYIPMEELRATNDDTLTAMFEGRWEEFGAESTGDVPGPGRGDARRDRRRASPAGASSRCATAA